ncbi:hypothetical protein RCO48_24465 [Peribacillus frigoritolerans]|nr:hypothetical protein [Peribacillus frigoritolerans]
MKKKLQTPIIDGAGSFFLVLFVNLDCLLVNSCCTHDFALFTREFALHS